MTCLVAQGGNVGGRIPECRERWHLNEVASGRIERPVAAVTDDRAGIGEEAVGMFDALDRIGDGLRAGVITVRQTVDLRHIESRIGLQERDFAVELFAGCTDLGLGEPAGEDDGGAAFTLADGAAKFDGLLERHPDRR